MDAASIWLLPQEVRKYGDGETNSVLICLDDPWCNMTPPGPSCTSQLDLRFFAMPSSSSHWIWRDHPTSVTLAACICLHHHIYIYIILATPCIRWDPLGIQDPLGYLGLHCTLLTRIPAAINVFPTVSILVIPCSWRENKQDGSHEPECIHILGLRAQTSAIGKRTFFCMHRALTSSQRMHLSNSSQRDN